MAKPFVTAMHALCASGVRAASANAAVWLLPSGEGMANAGWIDGISAPKVRLH